MRIWRGPQQRERWHSLSPRLRTRNAEHVAVVTFVTNASLKIEIYGPKKAAAPQYINNMQPDSDRLLFQSAAERNKTVSLRLSAPAEVLQQRCAKQTKVDFPLLFLSFFFSFYFFYYYYFFLCVMVPGEKSEQQRRLHI